MSGLKRLLPALLLLLGGCGLLSPKVEIDTPTTAAPAPQPVAAPSNGGIFQVSSYRPAFEDRRARFVGDLLVIQLNEKLNASKKGSSNVDRSSEMAVAIPTIQGFPGKTFQGGAISATTENTFDAEGETQSINVFTTTITVTVTEVLPNGNLRVGGEKQIGIEHNTETLRFTGVVDPRTILPGNTVSSTQVADARIDYRSAGYISEAQAMGWLARFFLTFMPF
ncbi:MAG TPA: flagellar basal body L-ring protein FlgH [Burkholderiales bacterium]|nr:flagellar basal body L-ring protein FlgH [Burkholderiales bacterium]